MKTAFIGDIHGCVDELRGVVQKAIYKTDHIVFLGDYVDRGPDSRAVIDLLLEVQRTIPGQTTFLQGNHDATFSDVLDQDDHLDTFLKMGGAKTVRSYIEPPYHDAISRMRQEVPQTHRDFLALLQTRYSGMDVVAVHNAQDAPRDGRFVIAGHATLTSPVPVVGDDAALIDTGCGTRNGGRLTCLVWPTLEWWQSDEWTAK